MDKVDLIINCYEKTCRKVLSKRLINNIVKQNKFKFNNIFIIINNVNNKKATKARAERLKRYRIISDYFFVEDYLDSALKVVKVSREELGNLIHYTDWALVALYIAKSNYMLHWDPDVHLEAHIDWITPSLRELKENRNYIVASPLWGLQEKVIKTEAIRETDKFLYNHDFSDQIFLTKRESLLKPIYNFNHIYSLRYPLAYLGSIFEKRIDSYMRIKNKTRIIYKSAIYVHPQDSGTPYPQRNIPQSIKHYCYMIIIVTYYFLFFYVPHIRKTLNGMLIKI